MPDQPPRVSADHFALTTKDQSILSIEHFAIEKPNGRLVVCHLGSEVGTIVNGARIAANEHSTTASLLSGNNLVSTGTLHSRFRFSIVVDRT